MVLPGNSSIVFLDYDIIMHTRAVISQHAQCTSCVYWVQWEFLFCVYLFCDTSIDPGWNNEFASSLLCRRGSNRKNHIHIFCIHIFEKWFILTEFLYNLEIRQNLENVFAFFHQVNVFPFRWMSGNWLKFQKSGEKSRNFYHFSFEKFVTLSDAKCH